MSPEDNQGTSVVHAWVEIIKRGFIVVNTVVVNKLFSRNRVNKLYRE